MVTTYPYGNREVAYWDAGTVTGVTPRQYGNRWPNSIEPSWTPAASLSWFDVILPFLRQRSTATWVEAHSQMDDSRTTIAADTGTKLHEFHDWLDSLPPVPHVPLEALSREHLY